MWNPFLVLGVDDSATAEVIGRAFLTASLHSHPDKGGTKEKMNILTAARDALMNEITKLSYLERTRPYLEGSMVQLKGLVRAAELNGKMGKAGRWTGLRLEVHVSGVGIKAVRPENTTVPMLNPHALAAAGEAFMPRHDGLVPCSGRDRIECPSWAWVRALKGKCKLCSAKTQSPYAKSSPPCSAPVPPQWTPPSTISSAPPLPVHAWSQEEISEASNTLAGAEWPTFKHIYDHVELGAFEDFDTQVLVKKARVLQLALQLAQRDGHFCRLASLLQQGKKGMESLVWTDAHRNGAFDNYYQKTAGDLVQSFWCRSHLEHMGQCFQTNPVQCSIAKWLHLPLLVLPKSIAESVNGWCEHALADFQEMLTLHLPSKLANLYLNVCTGYFLSFVAKGEADERCRHRNDLGILCCDKKVDARYSRFCSYGHYMDKRRRSRAAFNGSEYGPEYADLRKHDMLTPMEHNESGRGWSYAKNLRTGVVGWVPTDFIAPA